MLAPLHLVLFLRVDGFGEFVDERDFFYAVEFVLGAIVFDVETTAFHPHPVFSQSGDVLRVEAPLDGVTQIHAAFPLTDTQVQDAVVLVQDVQHLGMYFQEFFPLAVVPVILAGIAAEFLVCSPILYGMSTLQTSKQLY